MKQAIASYKEKASQPQMNRSAGVIPVVPPPPEVSSTTRLPLLVQTTFNEEEEEEDTMVYDYQMVQIPSAIEVHSGREQGNEAASYLQSLVNQYSAQGWNFYRVEEIGILSRAGCLASLLADIPVIGGIFGRKDSMRPVYVVVFRRPKAG